MPPANGGAGGGLRSMLSRLAGGTAPGGGRGARAGSTASSGTADGAAALAAAGGSAGGLSAPAAAPSLGAGPPTSPTPPTAVELFVEAVFDPHSERVSLATPVVRALVEGAARPVAAVAPPPAPAVSSASPVALSLADFAAGHVPAAAAAAEPRAGDASPMPPPGVNPAAAALLPATVGALEAAPDGLARFTAAMDARRGEGTQLTKHALVLLARAMEAALSAALASEDNPRGRALMVISQTFYAYLPATEEIEDIVGAGAPLADAAPTHAPATGARKGSVTTPPRTTSGGGRTATETSPMAHGGSATARRVYLQALLLDHPLWRSSLFWESAVYNALNTEHSKPAAKCVLLLHRPARRRRPWVHCTTNVATALPTPAQSQWT